MIKKLLYLITALAGLVTVAKADSDGNEDKNLQGQTKGVKDFFSDKDLLNSPLPKIQIQSLDPEQGPTYGETRVLVRGGPFSKWEQTYFQPKCKFGNNTVAAQYVKCSLNKTSVTVAEARGKERNYHCLQCENSPASEIGEQVVQLQVSLIGDFSDSLNSLPYVYYTPPIVEKIFPRYGSKDGSTPIQVFGKNFKRFGEMSRCAIGTKTMVADIKNDTYLECFSPFSDIVEKAMPFSLSFNGQQNSAEKIYYWYYNWPAIEKLYPERGPESGGTKINIIGRNFHPFKDILDEVDNSADCWCAFVDLKIRVRAEIKNSTRASCISPPSYYYHQSRVELTLNSAEYTDDENIFYYYKPPILFDVDPRMGPVSGGNIVTIQGTNFQDTGQIQCMFGEQVVNATFTFFGTIKCYVPDGHKPGYVDLKVSLKPNMWSSPVKYLYYMTPTVNLIGPSCGPDTGFTQILVTGKDFLDLGHNMAVCVFDGKIFTNATVMDENTLYCDSPPFQNSQGYSLLGSKGENGNFYSFQISLDGGHQINGENFKFSYYANPKVMGVSPFGGLIQGGTHVTVSATGLKQQEICDLRVRLSTVEIIPSANGDQITFKAPPVTFPSTTVVQVTYNGQQYQSERVIHYKDPLASYEYYVNPTISYHQPTQGPSNGGTKVLINGVGFTPFYPQDDGNNAQPPNRLWVRWINYDSGEALAPIQELPSSDFSTAQATIWSPPAAAWTKAIIQLSLNGQEWVDVKENKQAYSYTFFAPPHIQKVSPSFGPVKDTLDPDLTIEGVDFTCPEKGCRQVQVRFGDGANAIYVPGFHVNSNTIKCKIPKYTKPDVLRIELTLNGDDYTNDNKTYGYYDPYVIDAYPRLLHVDGSTIVKVYGLGFVDSGEIKTKFTNSSSPIQCSAGACDNVAKFIDKTTIETATFPQSRVTYKSNGESVMWDPVSIEVSMFSDQYTTNNIQLYYIREPEIVIQNEPDAPANNPADLFFNIKINPDDIEYVKRYSHSKCRFTSKDGKKVVYTEAILMRYPLTQDAVLARTPNTLKCKSPRMELEGNYTQADFDVDVSLNGQKYFGRIPFTITQPIKIHRIVPIAGPITGSNQMRLIGTGFRPKSQKLQVSSKWGPITTNDIPKSEVTDYTYIFQEFLTQIPGNDELKCYQYEAANYPRVDSEMYEGSLYDSWYMNSVGGYPNLSKQLNPNYNNAVGGPFYVEIGRNIKVDQGTQIVNNSTIQNSWTFYQYDPSSVEFYYYKQPTILKMHPQRGLTRGGTKISVIGFDFRYYPEYGVVPHCKFGDKIVRAEFESNVRIVCTSPNDDRIDLPLSFEVSLNGVDWTNSGFTYSYFNEPEFNSISTNEGPVKGGTAVYIKGKNFPKITSIHEFNVRFSPKNVLMGHKIVPVEWLNDTTILIMTPGGWSSGDEMNLQVTFNGEDYDQNGFTFTFYNIEKATPRSGPSNGKGGDIIITGQGFRPNEKPLCRLNNTVYESLSHNWTHIRCPMPAALDGPDFFGNVPFAVSPNTGYDWNTFEGGFQYYQQPTIKDIYPKSGPAHGVGIINFYGDNFRSDYALAKLGCKIGNSIGQAIYVSKTQMQCVVEELEKVEEGERLTAQVALNSYSWSQINDDPGDTGSTFYVPYSINALFPASGPSIGGSEILVIGFGFTSDGENQPRCRFGGPGNYAIVEAQVLSYTRLSCTSPPSFELVKPQHYPFETPFAVAMTQDAYDPWTETYHKFRYYKQPKFGLVDPIEVAVGSMREIIVLIDEEAEIPDNLFFQPLPSNMHQFDTNLETDDSVAMFQGMGGLRCRFGRFGDTMAVLVNSTAIKCITPSVPDDPSNIYREEVEFRISMNGYDFRGDPQPFLFVGTGSPGGLMPTVLLILFGGILIGALIYFFQNYYQLLSLGGQERRPNPNTGVYGGDVPEPNAYIIRNSN